MGHDSDLELRWANKHLQLHAYADSEYEWLAPSDPRCNEPVQVRNRASMGTDLGDRQGTLLVGDALHALKAMETVDAQSPRGGIRLVYIDPPYNTGRAFAQYADSLTHSAWLSMLRDRLMAVKPLLAPTGSVWVHLDDAEQHRARCVLDEVFGCEAFVATIVWQKRTTR